MWRPWLALCGGLGWPYIEGLAGLTWKVRYWRPTASFVPRGLAGCFAVLCGGVPYRLQRWGNPADEGTANLNTQSRPSAPNTRTEEESYIASGRINPGPPSTSWHRGPCQAALGPVQCRKRCSASTWRRCVDNGRELFSIVVQCRAPGRRAAAAEKRQKVAKICLDPWLEQQKQHETVQFQILVRCR